jgi:hypothetical protein
MPAPLPRRSTHRALRARDAGLRKISYATRALVVGSLAASGGFSALAAWAQPGRTKVLRVAAPVVGPGSATRTGGATGPTGGTVPATTSPTENLSPPETTPTTAPDPNPQYPPPTYQYTPPTYQYTPPTYQYTPPTYQYTPPVVVSGAS